MPAIDIFKWIASVLIIAFHIGPFEGISENAGFVLSQVIARLAVPFFLVCSGFFLGKTVKKFFKNCLSPKECRNTFLKTSKKLFILYIGWSLFYLLLSIPNWIKTGWLSYKAFIDWFITFFFLGSHYHLWYLISTAISVFILAFLAKALNKKMILPLIIILWLIGIMEYSYQSFLPDSFQFVFSRCERFPVLFSGVFRTLPLIFLGIYIQLSSKKKLKFSILGLCLSLALMTIEILWLKSNGVRDFGYILSSLPCAYFVFCVVHCFDDINAKKDTLLFSKMSIINYCVHPAIIETINSFVIIPNWLMFLVVTVISSIIGLSYYIIEKYLKNRRNSNSI